MTNEQKCDPYYRGKDTIHNIMAQMMDSVHKEFKTANVNMLRSLKKEMNIMNE